LGSLARADSQYSTTTHVAFLETSQMMIRRCICLLWIPHNVSRGQKPCLARKIRFRRHISGSVPRVSRFRLGCDVPVQASNPNNGHNRAVGNSIVVSSVSGPRKGSTTRLPEQTLDPSRRREVSRWSATLVTKCSWDSCRLWTIPPNHGQREQDLGLSSPWRAAITSNIQVFACP